jgi:hypothetical protein
MTGTLQIWNDKEVGIVKFRDKNEAVHSKKCKASDINIIDKLDKSTTARLRKEIAAEINMVEEAK